MKKIIKRILNWGSPEKSIRKMHIEKSYLEAYKMHSNIRVLKRTYGTDEKWRKEGEIFLDFLLKEGLKPNNNFLDVGCGTIRIGEYLTKYLDVGNYCGFDISEEVIRYAQEIIRQKGLSPKKPYLFINKDLRFRELRNRKFDFIWAQSVFTHLPPEVIEECFKNIGKIMGENSVFYFNYFIGDRFKHFSIEDFCYPFPHFQSLAKEYKFTLCISSDSETTRMVKIQKI